MPHNISFTITNQDEELIDSIVDRAMPLLTPTGADRMDIVMDITATHANGCELDLEKMLAADDFNFAHDIVGIYRHIDRSTGKLGNHFLPRFAKIDQRCFHGKV